jgi:hypothetical protein
MSMVQLQHLAASVLGCQPHEKIGVEESYLDKDGKPLEKNGVPAFHAMEVFVSSNHGARPDVSQRRERVSASVPCGDRSAAGNAARQGHLASELHAKLTQKRQADEDAATLARLGIAPPVPAAKQEIVPVPVSK